MMTKGICQTRLAIVALALPFGAFGAGIEFNRDVRPILSEYCFACHGPDSAARKADLRLDTMEGALASDVVVPGDAQGSEVIRRILSSDPDDVMPPPDAHKKPDPKEVETLSRWIEAGAVWQNHWAFIKPERLPLPHPNGIARWARNPIDHFIMAQSGELGLEQSPEADRHTLARRAAIDLTGLPPDKTGLEAYLTDDHPGAYDRYVDTLLASKHVGEHRARFWLDAARYGDTHGMHLDNYREMWPYRDWVINAFNANLPFNEFVIRQIAGDLLPNATLDDRIATGFNRCNVTTAEGGSIPEEINVRYMVDRVETTSTVFLGLTAGCAVCHDHKYDPLTMRDFYSLGAFFNNSTQPAMDGNRKDAPPVVVLPDDEHLKEWNGLVNDRNELRRELKDWKHDTAEWWAKKSGVGDSPVATDDLLLYLPMIEGGAVELPDEARWEEEHPAGARGMRFAKDGGFEVDLLELRGEQPLSVSFWVRTPDRVISSRLLEQQTTIVDEKDSKKKTTYGWKIASGVQGALTFSMTDRSGAKIDGLLPGDEALTPRQWQHVCVRYSGGLSKTSISILVNGAAGTPRPASQAYITKGELSDAKLKVAPAFRTGGLSDIRIFRRWLADDEITLLAQEFKLKKLLASDVSWKELSAAEQKLISNYSRNTSDSGYRDRSRKLSATGRRTDYIHARSTTTLVYEERTESQPRAWILKRGQYDQRGDEVAPNVPGMLPPMAEEWSRDRLGLARWLVHPDNPLTARVMVNRLWQSVFGTGLVRTAEDFGVMGDSPLHPALLDWLAVEFVESGWDVKHVLKLMVTSATYRQDGRSTPDRIRLDPDNRYLTRGPRLRLDAEVLRDQALSVSGLLGLDTGGPSVKPYQPSGLWKVVAFAGSNTRDFKQDADDALYRRSVYTFWKRTSPPPAMAAFDAPTREQCTVRRERTNTPLQALVLMNDPQYVEAARHLAQRTLTAASDDQQRAAWMFERALARPAADIDFRDMVEGVGQFEEHFKRQPDTAKALIETGDTKPDSRLDVVELAAWTMVANTLMNRDDFVNKN